MWSTKLGVNSDLQHMCPKNSLLHDTSVSHKARSSWTPADLMQQQDLLSTAGAGYKRCYEFGHSLLPVDVTKHGCPSLMKKEPYNLT